MSNTNLTQAAKDYLERNSRTRSDPASSAGAAPASEVVYHYTSQSSLHRILNAGRISPGPVSVRGRLVTLFCEATVPFPQGPTPLQHPRPLEEGDADVATARLGIATAKTKVLGKVSRIDLIVKAVESRWVRSPIERSGWHYFPGAVSLDLIEAIEVMRADGSWSLASASDFGASNLSEEA